MVRVGVRVKLRGPAVCETVQSRLGLGLGLRLVLGLGLGLGLELRFGFGLRVWVRFRAWVRV